MQFIDSQYRLICVIGYQRFGGSKLRAAAIIKTLL
jgi:hypothetical protein